MFKPCIGPETGKMPEIRGFLILRHSCAIGSRRILSTSCQRQVTAPKSPETRHFLILSFSQTGEQNGSRVKSVSNGRERSKTYAEHHPHYRAHHLQAWLPMVAATCALETDTVLIG